MSQAQQTRALAHVDPLTVGIVVLAVAAAVIHLRLGILLGPPSLRPFPLVFYLNALGYLVLVTALYAPPSHPVQRVVRWVFIAYTALTFVLWFLLAPKRDPVGYSTIVIEAVLVMLLIVDDRRSARGGGGGVGRTA
ncbi:MAG TPA: hypothetical protein VE201_01005 [Nitrospirales bacterium]|nr:hypothetical protein [Nitrospirales bacterium]